MLRNVRVLVPALILASSLAVVSCAKDDGSAAKIDELQKANAALEQRVAKLEREVESVTARVNSAEIRARQIGERLRDAEGVVDKMTSRMDRVESH